MSTCTPKEVDPATAFAPNPAFVGTVSELGLIFLGAFKLEVECKGTWLDEVGKGFDSEGTGTGLEMVPCLRAKLVFAFAACIIDAA